ncbi:hypothetical protein AURANDRAFT_67997 [Aureococcus anophagefferens]|uniref:Uncharacterized protein n=1 Tax=Aureococcus anophagefferens TaxID=44056 RepID=F0YN63_AURAN|nr:hypothetical protein AURANDRAFT_67997 [Aureococcus anophagefferens]EGB03459.1 hypothetical protein AURANDRAFT_67997 [Aureococcus anophagefferens]|eukprot:XP_009041858.1 hypothetical protein AURANDRAFT_67997 [Aureococcus anophagefferens]
MSVVILVQAYKFNNFRAKRSCYRELAYIRCNFNGETSNLWFGQSCRLVEQTSILWVIGPNSDRKIYTCHFTLTTPLPVVFTAPIIGLLLSQVSLLARTAMILSGLFNQTCSGVGVMYTSFARADSLEASEVCIINELLRDPNAANYPPSKLERGDPLALPPAIKTVMLTWDDPNVASLELNDLSTFNAMNPALLHNLTSLL